MQSRESGNPPSKSRESTSRESGSLESEDSRTDDSPTPRLSVTVRARHRAAALHLARCAEVVVTQAVAEMSARIFGQWVLVRQQDVVSLREAVDRLWAVWERDEEA